MITSEDGRDTRISELPLSKFQRGVENCTHKLQGRVKHCGRNAFHQLRRAWLLIEADAEMAAFRAITAEEEAATALILALKQQRYPGADRLDYRKHDQKAAFTPFLNAVAKVLEQTEVMKPAIRLSESDPPKVTIALDVGSLVNPSKPYFAIPDDPLDFIIRPDSAAKQEAHTFEAELREIAEGGGYSDIIKFLRNEANLRNKLLYASDNGIPTVKISDGFILERLRRVTVLMTLVIAVLQTPRHQLFAVQCLGALLRAIKRIEDGEFPFDEPEESPGPLLSVVAIHGEPVQVSVTRRYTIQNAVSWQFVQPWTITI